MDNLDKLIEAIEHPENFSDTELQSLLSDPEVMQLYKILCATRAKNIIDDIGTSNLEIDRQWSTFNKKRRRHSFMTWVYSRKAVAVAAVFIISCSVIVVGVSLNIRNMKETEKVNLADEVIAIDSEPAIELKPTTTIPNDTVIVFEDEKLDKILMEVAPYYSARVDLKAPHTKEIRLFLKWDSSTPLEDLIDHLNSFDRINLFLKEDLITDYQLDSNN